MRRAGKLWSESAPRTAQARGSRSGWTGRKACAARPPPLAHRRSRRRSRLLHPRRRAGGLWAAWTLSPPALPPLARLPVAAVLRDGTPAVVRAGGAPGDRDLLLAGFEQFSAASRYHRFLTVVPTLTEGMLHRLVDEVDGRDHVVVVLAPADQPDHAAALAMLRRLGCTQVTVQGSGVYRVQVELGPDASIPDSPS